ncbi:L-threonylcarbamoyladenylate synthase [Elusimicrobium minutum]|nr:L-threonylcarbamoyladenylate synthase [Elusimicrobium minutum]
MMKTRIFKIEEVTKEIMLQAVNDLKNGAVIIAPTDTVYGIMADALNPQAVKRMCEIKQKPSDVPLQYLASDIKYAKRIALFSPKATLLAEKYWPGPLTIIVPPSKEGKKYLRGFDTLGIRVPKNDFIANLLNAFGGVAAASSANLHSKPVINSQEELIKEFNGKVDYIFTGGQFSSESSTVLSLEPFKIFREGGIKEKDVLNFFAENANIF